MTGEIRLNILYAVINRKRKTCSKFKVTTNPFEAGLIERMKRPSFLSPNVMKMSSSTEETEFQWTIDDLSRIAPVPIDEDNTHSQCTDTLDSEAESDIQEVIDKYFTHHHAIPSPCWKSPHAKYGTAASSTPENKKSSPANSVIEKCNMGTQTMLSLPPKLPENIEELLKPYFLAEENVSFDEGDNSLNLSNSRRKLRFSPACSTMERSPIVSGHHVSPTHMSLLPTTPIIKSRTLFSPANIESPTEISPIINSFNKTATKMLTFSSGSDSSSSSNYQTPSNSSINETQCDISMMDTTQKTVDSKTEKRSEMFQDTGYNTNETSNF
ncbi:hypothetical protein M8J75_001788 [Diaphorina citri]|nr:hypothetical protein M8J75_001788 [Diaphorina citri]